MIVVVGLVGMLLCTLSLLATALWRLGGRVGVVAGEVQGVRVKVQELTAPTAVDPRPWPRPCPRYRQSVALCPCPSPWRPRVQTYGSGD
jgi:hypothetical protein